MPRRKPMPVNPDYRRHPLPPRKSIMPKVSAAMAQAIDYSLSTHLSEQAARDRFEAVAQRPVEVERAAAIYSVWKMFGRTSFPIPAVAQ